MSRDQDSPVIPDGRPRALLCGCLLVALLAGCQQWRAGDAEWASLFDRSGSSNWHDVYRIESPDVLRVRVVDAQSPSMETVCPVSSDGTIDLGEHGTIDVAGKPLAEAARKIERRLDGKFHDPHVALAVEEHNSPYYYIIRQGRGRRDTVERVPFEQGTTVLDAVARLHGISDLSYTDFWIERPNGSELNPRQIYPVDWEAITRGAETTTNYVLKPGDVFCVAEGEWIGREYQPAQLERHSISSKTIEAFQKLGSDSAEHPADSSY